MKRLIFVAFFLLALALYLIVPGLASAAAYAPAVGGTGTTTPPRYGQLLVGNANKTYTLTSTSSLGLPTFADLSGLSAFSTTSADYWKTQRNFFATTSADFWKTQTSFFSTTSADWWQLQSSFFSTTSVAYWMSVTNLFSTTSTDFWKTQRNFFSTSSADWWKTQTDLFSTTSATYFAHSSTTIPKTYTANTWTALQTFGNSSTTNASFGVASSTNQTIGTLSFGGVTSNAWSAFCIAITGGAGLCDGTDATGSSSDGLATTSIAATFPIIKTTTSAAVTLSFGGLSTSTPWTTSGVAYRTSDNTVATVATGTVSSSGGITTTASRSVLGGALSISCDVASGSIPGCLSAADWVIFNAKLSSYDAFTHPTTFATTTSATSSSLWTQGVFFSSSTKAASQFPYASTTQISAQHASTTGLTVSGTTNALALMGTTGILGAYGGAAACTNQVVTAISAVGATTCSSVANAMLTNSTISGIALGSNLADLTATNASLTFSGAYNGGIARTVGLNVGNANTWTALQTFAYASTTGISASYATSTLYYGAGLANCNTGNMLTWTDGRFGCEDDTTGGGAGFAYLFNNGLTYATSTAATTTSIWSQGVFFSSSTKAASQFPYASSTALTAGNLFSTNATTTALSASSFSFGGVNGSTWPSFCTAITGSAGLCDGSDDGGGGGGVADSKWATSTDGTGIYANAATAVGIGSSTPWGLLSIANDSPDHTTPLFAIATSSDVWGQLLAVSATSSPNFGHSGVRVTLGTTSSSGLASMWPFLLNGPEYSTYGQIACDAPGRMGNLTADSAIGTDCPGGAFTFDEDATAATYSPTTRGYSIDDLGRRNVVMFAGAAANSNANALAGDGAAVITWGGSAYFNASSSPLFEALIAASSTNATSTMFKVGLIATYEDQDHAPSDASLAGIQGFFFVATSGGPNWIAAAKPGAAAMQFKNTGISSTTANTITYQKLNIFVVPQGPNTSAYYYIDNNLVAIITGSNANAGAALSTLAPQASVGAITAGKAKSLAVAYIRAWWRVVNF